MLKKSNSPSLNTNHTPPMTEALGVVGLYGRANQGGGAFVAKKMIYRKAIVKYPLNVSMYRKS